MTTGKSMISLANNYKKTPFLLAPKPRGPGKNNRVNSEKD